MTNKIILGDCIEEMKKLEENSVDAIITDPPYGLGFMNKEWDSPKKHRELVKREKKRSEQRKKEGKSPTDAPFSKSVQPGLAIKGAKEGRWFQEWYEKVSKECLRVLKPGGYFLSFGATRMYHRMTCGIEDAGFEIRDCIQWLYGSGFPKSLNIGKQIDKIRGNERELIRIDKRYNEPSGIVGIGQGERTLINREVTKGNSEWEGWGTALKPAVELIVVARKPLSEKNVALNVLKHGTGGINIDGCRIGYKSEKDKNGARVGFKEGEIQRGEYNIMMREGTPLKSNNGLSITGEQGRFPANLILECTCDELKEGKDPSPKTYIRKSDGFNQIDYGKGVGQKSGTESKNYGGNKAKIHTNPNCPCYMLDKQSGESKSSSSMPLPEGPFSGLMNKKTNIGINTFRGHNDKGGASRFFYCAKASKSERNLGCEQFKNGHPTVKLEKLIQYLIKLVSKEGATILDPFVGSGTTAIACLKLNRKFIGIEKEEEYIKIAKSRMDFWKKPKEERERIIKNNKLKKKIDKKQKTLK